ncbi:hypothetical protein GCM10022255_080730 [Dactylosporangium darangshiense]|uniref:Uncharacterized protein n=2 Tax=Dactylosporangium darangshiense TaxID=579108 RepID=A0ABP8DL61_9ACTN
MLGYQRVLEARDPATPPGRLRELAADDVRPVRLLVARNFDTPREVLERLTRDEDGHVRWCATYTLNFPEMAVRWHANGGQISASGPQLSGFLHDVVHHPGVPGSLRAEVLAAGVCPSGCPRRRYDVPGRPCPR